ncbi:GNAT family N-acetyltransferase [Chitiniphilus purpureus]|uniref:GNAT family N-acetyltransferase n=1 Tax=Chitiniphilus purpureus TaxID=2981137 RepID=A0ABY6DM14_9NEIS|nr:GNAT family N-acetyltransferase [Chitiniphilus sp. CD1]UXY15405.1 GNAT family N-acetyltransferase [Chitiniphilus sp. CD1]
MTHTGLFTIRLAGPDDYSAAIALVRAVFLATIAKDQSEAEVSRCLADLTPAVLALRAAQGQPTWVALAGNEVIGMLHRRDATHLALLFVVPAWQRRGVGRALLAEAERCGRLVTVRASVTALAAYERYGFAATGPLQTQSGLRYLPMKRVQDIVPEQDLSEYLAASAEIDFHHPAVAGLARTLHRASVPDTAHACFDWVRDRIEHCGDFQREAVPCSASETLAAGTGFCFAKSHLLVALLRANGIAAGFGYQRLTWEGPTPPYCLHGFAAVWLHGHGWYRCDPRGNTLPGVDCHFTPDREHLAFPIAHPGECTYPDIHAQPLPELIALLRECESVTQYRQRPIDLVPC